MKTFLLVLLVGSGLLACKKATTSPAAPTIGQPFDLPYQQTATLLANGSPIHLTLKQVYESRCPIGAECIWAGYAAVDVELTDASATPQTARIGLRLKGLPTADYTADSVSVTLNNQVYWLRLLDVTPHPSLSPSGQATAATLRLRPR